MVAFCHGDESGFGWPIVVPKALRDALGLIPGSTVDISVYGAGLM